MFPEELIALNREVSEHPPLIEILANLGVPASDWIMRVACIAAYCEVILDGAYSETDIRLLCDTLTNMLKEKRAIIIDTSLVRPIITVPHLEPAPDEPPPSTKILLH